MNLVEDCTLQRLRPEMDLAGFNCGNPDLNDFLKNDALHYDRQLLGRTYVFTLDNKPDEIVCFFTVSNDSLRVENLTNNTRRKINKEIDYIKQRKNYPAVLVGRLGVNKSFKQKLENAAEPSLGDQLMDFIKGWFSNSENKTGCRFIVVDAYNDDNVLRYYKRNGFLELQSKETQDLEYNTEKLPHTPPRTKAMFFDLIQVS